MSTRSRIAKVNEDGTVTSIYCHFDGYLEGVGATLIKYHNSPEAASKIVALGDISSLDESVEAPEGHSFDTPIRGYTVAYGRDRHETGTEFIVTKSLEEFFKARYVQFVDYIYFFQDGEWFVSSSINNVEKLSTLISSLEV